MDVVVLWVLGLFLRGGLVFKEPLVFFGGREVFSGHYFIRTQLEYLTPGSCLIISQELACLN